MNNHTISSIDAIASVSAWNEVQSASPHPTGDVVASSRASDPGLAAKAVAGADADGDALVETFGEQMALATFHFMSQELSRLRAQTDERFRELRQDEG